MKQHTASFLLLTLAGCASTGSIADRTEYRYSSEKSAKSLADCYYLLGEDKAGTGMFLERVDLSESLGEYRVHLYYDRDGYKNSSLDVSVDRNRKWNRRLVLWQRTRFQQS